MSNYFLAPKAEADLDELHAYIAFDNPDAADRLLKLPLSHLASWQRVPISAILERFPDRHSLIFDPGE